MKFNELPIEIQEQLNAEREELKSKHINTPYKIHIYNADGTRYFCANRVCRSWNDNKGNYMPFGGGTYWTLIYGKVQFQRYRNVMGETDYSLCDGDCFKKSANGTIIPSRVETKKEVLGIIKQIGIFEL